jgi:autotransporter-associated beta strand protein
LGDTAISGIQSWTLGTGATLAIGAISRTAGSGTTLTLSNTGTFSTSTTDSSNGIIGGWALIKTGASSYGFAHSGSSGTNTITAAATSALGTGFSGDNSTVNWINSDGNTTITAATQVNSFTSANDVTVSGLLTIGSGGVILGNNASKWFKNGTGGQLTTGLASGELFIHTANASSNDMRVWTPIVDNGSTPTILVKDGPGYLGLQPSANNNGASVSNPYTGGSILNGGTVALSGAQPLGTGAVQLTGATLTTFSTGNNATTATVANNIAVSGNTGFNANTGGNLTLNGTLTGSGNLTFGNNGANSSVFVGLTNSLSIGSTITLANATNAVRFSSASAGNASVAFVFNNTNANKETLDFTTGTISFGSMAGAGLIQGNNATGTKTISEGGLNTSTTFSGAIGGGAGTIALTKVGTGTFTLSGNNTYTGPTTINAGTLALGASERISNSSPMVLGGGSFATGGFSETLNTLTLSSSSSIDFGAGASTVTFADSSSIGWTGTLSLLNFDVGTDFLNFSTSTGLTGTQLSEISLAGFTASGLDANGNVTFTAVPEPGAMALLVTGMGCMVMFARRKRHAA